MLQPAKESQSHIRQLFSPTYDAAAVYEVGLDPRAVVAVVSTRRNSAFVSDTEMDSQLLAIQSAPASRSSTSGAVVRQAMTRAPDALPARIPAGASSTTTQSFAAIPSNDAPFR